MPKIKYSYIFDEEIDRVYESFSNIQLIRDIAFCDFITNLKFIKGERFDEENSEFSFVWKNYYNIKMIVQNHIIKENFRTYTHKSLFIDKVVIEISLIFYFYWDTIEQKTIFILDLEYKDEFFADLIKSEVKLSDIEKVCENVEKYINGITQGLEFSNSFLLNVPIEELWKTISNPAIFFTISGKKLIPIFKDKQVNIDSTLEFIDSNDKKSESTILTQLIVDNLFVTSSYIKLSFVSFKRLYLTSHRITFIIKKIETNKSVFIVQLKVLEPCTHKLYLTIIKFWKKIITNYYNYFSSKYINNKKFGNNEKIIK
jgi:hypothetical protein